MLLHVLRWDVLETARLSWRHIGADEVFRSDAFWKFALVSTLLHTGPAHLALNLWCLSVLGPAFERRYGAGTFLALWVVDGYLAMGSEALIGGLGRIGLSAFTYALLGVTVVRWRQLRTAPRQFWTALAMLALLVPGALDALGYGPFAPEIAHAAHAIGLVVGIVAGLILGRIKKPPFAGRRS